MRIQNKIIRILTMNIFNSNKDNFNNIIKIPINKTTNTQIIMLNSNTLSLDRMQMLIRNSWKLNNNILAINSLKQMINKSHNNNIFKTNNLQKGNTT
jgi:hypothetical protein